MKNLPKYWDAASTTPVDPRVVEKMLPYFSEIFGNASSNHIYGKQTKIAIEDARTQVSSLINADPKEIIFTSGSTEAINLAIKGYLEANPEKGNHIITVKTEHKAVLNTCEYLESKGYEVTYLNVDQNGLINMSELENSISVKTAMICVMFVNNEIGIIQDIPAIGEIARNHEIAFFTDATQAVGQVLVDVISDNIDMLCLSAHKFKGPKGVGALYVKRGLKLTPLIHGGGQENALRGGTLNTPLIVGLGEAARLAKSEFHKRISLIERNRLEIENFFINNNIGSINFKNQPRAPHILSISLLDKEAEDFLIERSQEFVASTGSACSSNILEFSHVLQAIKMNNNVIRLSFYDEFK